MMEQKAADYFGTFLKSVKGRAGAGSEGGSLKLLQVLEEGPLPLPELIKATELPFERFAEALQGMRRLDLVVVRDEVGAEVVELTPEGAQLAKLAHE